MKNKMFSFIESFLIRIYLRKHQKRGTRDLGPCFCRVKTTSARGTYQLSFSARVEIRLEPPRCLRICPDKGEDLAYLKYEFKNKTAKLRVKAFSPPPRKKGNDLIIFSAILTKKQRGRLVFALERGGPNRLFWEMV